MAPTPVHVCLLPRSVFASKDLLIHHLITTSSSSSRISSSSSSITSALTPNIILNAPSAALYPLLTLILCALDEEDITTPRFLALTRALRDRCATNRVLKHRLLTMLNHASFPGWHLRTILRRSAYQTSRARLRAAVEPRNNNSNNSSSNSTTGMKTRSVSSTSTSTSTENDNNNNESNYNVSRTFCEYVAQIIFAPSKVKQWATPISTAATTTTNNAGDNKHHQYTHQTNNNNRDIGPLVEHTFSMTGLTNAVRDTPGIINDEHATLIVTKLIEYKLASATIDDDDSGEQARQAEAQAQQSLSRSSYQQQLGDSDDDDDDDDLRDVHMKNMHTRRLRTSFTNAMRDAEVVHMRTRAGRMLSGGMSQLGVGDTPSSIELDMPVDMIDLQSLDFWTEHIYEKNAEKGVHFGIRTVVHPLLIGSVERDGNVHNDDQMPFAKTSETKMAKIQDDCLINRVVVTKVFSSLSRPCMAELKRFTEGTNVDTEDVQTTVYPSLLIKKGDNLMQDHCVSVMFQIFNFIWRHGTAYRGLGTVPHCFAYEVVPTSVQMGYIEGVSNVQSLGDVDWKAWYARHAHEPSGIIIDNLVHSAAGAFVGGYVMGATDRHWGNMVLKDDTTLLHIDFSFILGDAPPIDAPRISVPPAMEKVFKGVRIGGDNGGGSSRKGTSASLWDAFVEATVAAFVALRKDARVVLRAADMLFSHAGFDRQKVREFLKGKSGLALEKTEEQAADYLRRKLIASSGHWKTHFKRFVHDVVNPAWYAMVQKGPLPADGVMRMINRYQAESSSTQRLTMQQDIKNEQSMSAVNIGE